MKIKRFKNLWTMGLILFGAILVLFYIAKIFFPEFIVGVAEIPSIVAFGNFVDSHWWAFAIYQIIISCVGAYIYCCACFRIKRLNNKKLILLIAFFAFGFLAQQFLKEIYAPFNYVIFVFMPFLMLAVDKELSVKTFSSTIICYTIDIMAQAMSMCIRNIVLLSTCLNSATMTILLIDTWIWRTLLYMFFNNKKESE